MGPVSAEIEIDAPRERVFATLLDLAARASFTDHFLTDFHLTRIDSVGVGAGARFCVKAPLRKVWMDTAILSTEEPHKIVEEGEAGRANRIRCHTVWELKEGPGPLTTVRVAHGPNRPRSTASLEIAQRRLLLAGARLARALRRLRDR